MKVSIRPRLLLGMTAMIIPLIILAAGSYYYLVGALHGLDEVMEETLQEAYPAGVLQNLLTRAAMPANDYLLNGDPAERDKFAALETQIDSSFDSILSLRFGNMDEYIRIKGAEREWFEGRLISRNILALENPVGNTEGLRQMFIMDQSFDRATDMIESMNRAIISEASLHASLAHEKLVKLRALIIVLVALGVLGGAGIGYYIAHSIVNPLLNLQRGVQRFRGGDLTTRIEHDYQDEIGELADNFNQMAERLRELTITDELTGLYNRREFNRLIVDEFSRARRYNHDLSLLVMDIDHFKQVNDTNGHLAGDEVLKGVAARITELLRPENKVARFGGEEMVAVLPETNLAGALAAAERVREAIAESPFLFGHKKIPITISIGVSSYPEKAADEEGLISQADAAVYRAKWAGRNRTEI